MKMYCEQNEERNRLNELYHYSILDTEEEQDFNDLVKLASQICEVPISMISLVDDTRQWFKAKIGIAITETPREIAFCGHVIQGDDMFIVNDASKDPRFLENPLVTSEPFIRFYAGVPLVTSRGYKLGTLCVIDKKPNDLTSYQKSVLELLSNQVMKLLELRLSIRQLKEAKEKIATSNMLFRSMTENAPVGIYQTNAEGKGVYVNPQWCEIAGVTEHEALVKGWAYTIFPEDRAKVLRIWNKSRITHSDFDLEFRFEHAQSGFRWVKCHASPMYDDVEQFCGYVGIIVDITQKKADEKKLKESEEKYRLISANSRDVIAVLASNDNPIYTFLSPSVKEVFGYQPEELIGRSAFAIIHPEDLPDIKKSTQSSYQKGQSQLLQHRVIRKDGTLIYVESVSGLAYDDHGKEVGILVTIRDITEQKLAEFRLEESERRYRLISTNSNDLLTIFEATQDARCIFVSPSCKDIIGYEPGEIIGLSPFQMMVTEDVNKIKDYFLPEILAGKKIRMESRAYRKDGQLIWMEALLQPIVDEDGKISTFQASIRDITERKNLEEQLKAEKLKAEETTLTKSQFLSSMSHEIRTPMNGIIGLTNLLLEEDPREDQLELLNLLKFSGENLLTLIDDILDLNKIEAGKVELENIPFNLKTLLQKHVHVLTHRANNKNIELNLDIQNELPRQVNGDPTRIGQVLINLIGNAIKFTEKGQVSLIVSVVEKSEDAHRIQFRVKDTGIGIKQEKLEAIFENFTQASSDTTRKYGGTGLGLSIAKKLLSLMGGQLSVSSEFGIGTEFIAELWFKESCEEVTIRNEKIKRQALKMENIQVLLTEDNLVNQMVAGNYLKKWGMAYTIANNGKEALALVQEKYFDLVLMDLQMPELDGYEATRQIRLLEGTYFKSLPIIALSASAMVEERVKVMEYGFDDFLSKPFQPGELMEKIINKVNDKIKLKTVNSDIFH